MATVHRRLAELKLRHGRRRVLVLDDLNAAYVPIPKVASTTLRRLLAKHQIKASYPELHSLPAEARLAAIEQKIRRSLRPRACRRLGKDHLVFAFVRHPLTRLHSCYIDKVQLAAENGKRFTLSRYGAHPDMDFPNFVRHVATIPDSRSEQHFRSQSCWLYDRGKPLIGFVGRLETLDDDWASLRSRIALPPIPGRRRESGAVSALSGLPMDRATAGIAIARYQRDIDLLGYGEATEAWLRQLSN